jgi:hypothetical protein
MLDYKNNLLSEEWDYIEIKNSEIYNITVFDDGNQRHESLKNEWYLFGIWKGKCALVNKHNPDIIIQSISRWKITN